MHVDPIEHAWRYCNPHVPLPSALAARAPPSGLEISLDSFQGQLVAESPATTQDIQSGFLTVATLPRISPADETVRDGGTALHGRPGAVLLLHQHGQKSDHSKGGQQQRRHSEVADQAPSSVEHGEPHR